MENDRLRVLEKEQKRYNVLKAVYDCTHGQENQPVNFGDVRQITALSGEEIIQTSAPMMPQENPTQSQVH